MSRKKNSVSIFRIRWIYLIGMIVIVGGVQAFGLVATLFLGLDQKRALSMVWMIIPMTVVYIIAIRILLMGVKERQERLIDAIDAVANGDTNIEIPLDDAQEYETVYQDFNAMVKELKKTREEMDTFINEFTHEFRTPITSISGFSQILLENNDSLSAQERKEYLEVIAEQSRRLLTLSQNALLLSKVEAMQIVIEKETYDLLEQIRRCVILLYRMAEEKQIAIDLPENSVLNYYGNREMMEHVWINLLNNAIKFTPDGGTVSIDGRSENGAVIVSITDSGIGMDAETCAHIFERYYQNDTVSLSKGSGIGLAIVKRIVTLAEGEITVESTVGKGSTFTVTLPERIPPESES